MPEPLTIWELQQEWEDFKLSLFCAGLLIVDLAWFGVMAFPHLVTPAQGIGLALVAMQSVLVLLTVRWYHRVQVSLLWQQDDARGNDGEHEPILRPVSGGHCDSRRW
jgi:hypothetical protein